MNHLHITILLCTLFTLSGHTYAGMFTPSLQVGFEGGATRSYLETDNQMTYFFAPTSGIEKPIRPAFTITVDLLLGNYLGIASGMGYRHFGQSTAPTTVFLNNDIFEHDFESQVRLDYFAVPFVVKAGIRRPYFSVFVRGGITPSLLVDSDFGWVIDHKKVETGSSRVPDVEIKNWDVPLHFGGEAGVYFGKNGIFLIGQYNYGIHNVAYGITGKTLLRSYGVTLSYRRVLF